MSVRRRGTGALSGEVGSEESQGLPSEALV